MFSHQFENYLFCPPVVFMYSYLPVHASCALVYELSSIDIIW